MRLFLRSSSGVWTTAGSYQSHTILSIKAEAAWSSGLGMRRSWPIWGGWEPRRAVGVSFAPSTAAQLWIACAKALPWTCWDIPSFPAWSGLPGVVVWFMHATVCTFAGNQESLLLNGACSRGLNEYLSYFGTRTLAIHEVSFGFFWF